jgi:DNA repair exonuclease SbcCD ATPase subunit
MKAEVHARVTTLGAAHAEPSIMPSQDESPKSNYEVDLVVQMEKAFGNAQKAFSEATLRANSAEARATAAEAAIAKKEKDIAAAESALQAEIKRLSARAARLDAELSKERRLAADSLVRLKKQAGEDKQLREPLEIKLADCSQKLQARSEELCLRSAELEEARSALKQRDAEIIEIRRHHLAEVGELEGALQIAESRVHVAERMVLDAQEDTKEAIAQAQMASVTLQADFVAKERERLENEFNDAMQSQKSEFEAKLKAGLRSMEAQLADAKRRSEAELQRRFMLVEGREQDASKIVQLQEQADKHLKDLEFSRREVDGLRRRLHKLETTGRGLAPSHSCGSSSRSSRGQSHSCGSSSRCSSTPVTPPSMNREYQEASEIGLIENSNKRRLGPLSMSAEKLVNPRPFDSTRSLPSLLTKSFRGPCKY